MDLLLSNLRPYFKGQFPKSWGNPDLEGVHTKLKLNFLDTLQRQHVCWDASLHPPPLLQLRVKWGPKSVNKKDSGPDR